MTDNRFVTAQPKMLPYWIADDQGDAFERTFGATKDSGIALYEQAVNCHYPYAFNADVAPLRGRPDALPYQAHDRMLLRAPHELDGDFAARLLRAPDTWKWGGTPTAMVGLFEPYQYTAATCFILPNSAVILEGDPKWFSRYIILTDAVWWGADTPWDTPVDTWDSDPEETWDSTLTVGDASYIRASVRIMKSDQSFPVLWGTRLVNGGGDGFWDGPPLPDDYDAYGAVWDDDESGILTIRLGYLWDDAYIDGADEEPAWDSDPDEEWVEPAFVEPATGWPEIV